jgi:hypothetical protein
MFVHPKKYYTPWIRKKYLFTIQAIFHACSKRNRKYCMEAILDVGSTTKKLFDFCVNHKLFLITYH